MFGFFVLFQSLLQWSLVLVRLFCENSSPFFYHGSRWILIKFLYLGALFHVCLWSLHLRLQVAVQYIQDLTIISLLENLEISHVYRLGLFSFAVHSKIYCAPSCSFLSFFMSALLLPGKQGKSCIPACQYAPLSVKFLLLQVFRLLHMQMCTITVSALTPAFSIIPYRKIRLRQIY